MAITIFVYWLTLLNNSAPQYRLIAEVHDQNVAAAKNQPPSNQNRLKGGRWNVADNVSIIAVCRYFLYKNG